ncbi:MAG: M1 family metallopeptidase [Candidatus Aminicenantes bacterium]|nr:M1 family metallopeptidase [Candidatus Aminicenantes bacterium]
MKKAALVLSLAVTLSLTAGGQTVDWSAKAVQSERTRSYDALHYLIRIRLDLDGKAFDGSTTVTLASLREGLETCSLDAEEFTVTSVLAADGSALAFSQTDKALEVRLPRPLGFGEETSLTCIYRGRDPKDGLRFMAGTEDHPALVYSDSWPDHVHHWFPCYDYPNDKATTEIVATVRRGLKVAANGRLVSTVEDRASGTATYHWSQDRPHSTYLVFLAAGPYVVVRDSYKTLPVSYWVYPADEAKALPTYGKTPKMMAFFERTFGTDYPWRKYDQVSVPNGGGMESTSSTAMTHTIMVDARNEEDFPAIGIVSHELAHQWWGDFVTLRSWAHTWINESFGTYSDYLYHRYEKGDDEGAVDLRGKLDAYLREARSRYIRPIVTDRYDAPEDMFDAHTYPKGARVLHMLRALLGDEPFFRTLGHFLRTYAFDAVDTGDFVRSVKTVTGRDLDWFFDQWLYKPGHPVLEVGSEWDAASNAVRLRVAQVQDLSKGTPVFRMPVSIKLVTSRRTDIRTIWVDKKEETFVLPLEEKPLLVRFDEGNVLIKEIRFPKELDELLFQLGHDDVIGRMDAAAALPDFKDDPRTEAALATSLRSDPFWAVRKSAVEALARSTAKSRMAVLKGGVRDADPRVRAAALAALGDLRDRALIGLFKERFDGDPSDRVRAEALTAIGKAGDPSNVPFLRRAAAVPSYRHMVRRAAEAAIKLLDGK